jgi:hypothetical protein
MRECKHTIRAARFPTGLIVSPRNFEFSKLMSVEPAWVKIKYPDPVAKTVFMIT